MGVGCEGGARGEERGAAFWLRLHIMLSWDWSWEVAPGPMWTRGHHTVGLSKRERREKMWRQGEREVGLRGRAEHLRRDV